MVPWHVECSSEGSQWWDEGNPSGHPNLDLDILLNAEIFITLIR